MADRLVKYPGTGISGQGKNPGPFLGHQVSANLRSGNPVDVISRPKKLSKLASLTNNFRRIVIRESSRSGDQIRASSPSISVSRPTTKSTGGVNCTAKTPAARAKEAIRSDSSKRMTGGTAAVSSTKFDKRKTKVGVTISEDSKRCNNAGSGQTSKVGGGGGEEGKQKGVVISETKTRTNERNVGKQELDKGKKVETSQKKTPPSTRFRARVEPDNYPVHHIVWNGPDERKLPRQACPICDNDLSKPSPCSDDTYEDEYGYYFEQDNLPAIGVLACGHVFHAECLEAITPPDMLADPMCFSCGL